MEDLNMYINKDCVYPDNMGVGKLGRIQAIEIIDMMDGETIYLVYITDETNQDLNIHMDLVNGVPVKYAEIRPSDEIFLCEE